MNISDCIRKITEQLKKSDFVVFAYLHGSVATGNAHPFSDIDIAVFVDSNDLDSAFFEILRVLPDCKRPIDLRLLNDSPPLFRYNVLKRGKLLFTRDKRKLEKFIFETLVEALEIKEIISNLRKKRVEAILYAHRKSSECATNP